MSEKKPMTTSIGTPWIENKEMKNMANDPNQDNRSNQLNPNNDQYYKDRGYKGGKKEYGDKYLSLIHI